MAYTLLSGKVTRREHAALALSQLGDGARQPASETIPHFNQQLVSADRLGGDTCASRLTTSKDSPSASKQYFLSLQVWKCVLVKIQTEQEKGCAYENTAFKFYFLILFKLLLLQTEKDSQDVNWQQVA